MAELQTILNSGDITNINLGGTGPSSAVVKVEDMVGSLQTAEQSVDPLIGYAASDDVLLVHDITQDAMRVAEISQIPGNYEIVTVPTNIGSAPSAAELDAAIPNPVVGRIYMVMDVSNHTFTVVYDSADWWFERLTRAS